MARWEAKKNATDSDARRMYVRGRKKTLEIKGLPLDDALAYAQVSPAVSPHKSKALSKRSGVVAVPPNQVPKKTERKESKWSIGKSASSQVLRLPASQPVPKGMKNKRATGKKGKQVPVKGKALDASQSKSAKKQVILQYEGQQRFEGGSRIVQGGLLGSRTLDVIDRLCQEGVGEVMTQLQEFDR